MNNMKPKTLRDEFAMAVLVGMFSGAVKVPAKDDIDEQSLAQLAYKIAGAMLAEREKSDKK